MSENVLSVLVDNHSGVLARIASLFGRRGFNIDSLSVSATDDPGISRITIVTHGDESELQQILCQTEKLIETRAVFSMEEGDVFRELLLVKLSLSPEQEPLLLELAKQNHAKLLDLSPGGWILERTGTPEEQDLFLALLEPFAIQELCRTGLTALQRGPRSYQLKPNIFL